MHSVTLEPAKSISVGTQSTFEATEDGNLEYIYTFQ